MHAFLACTHLSPICTHLLEAHELNLQLPSQQVARDLPEHAIHRRVPGGVDGQPPAEVRPHVLVVLEMFKDGIVPTVQAEVLQHKHGIDSQRRCVCVRAKHALGINMGQCAFLH